MSPGEQGIGYRSALSPHCSPLSLRIADINISILTQDPELRIGVEGAAKQFLTHSAAPSPAFDGRVKKPRSGSTLSKPKASGRAVEGLATQANPDVMVQARWGDDFKQCRGEKVFDSGALWQLYSENGAFVFQFTSPALGSTPYKIASFNQDFTKGEVSLNRSCFDSDQTIYPLEYPLDELLMINLLASNRGVEIHACGIVDPLGRGHLFVGQSGAGKTTMAKLWENEPVVKVLSDDRIILRKTENTIWMYGTPWHGEAMLASPSRAPLTAVYFLEKGQKNELISQKASNFISRLFTCSFPPFYNRDALDFSLGFLEGVVRDAPCYELKFIPDKSVVEFIQEERFT
jgi:hypothetical protein